MTTNALVKVDESVTRTSDKKPACATDTKQGQRWEHAHRRTLLHSL